MMQGANELFYFTKENTSIHKNVLHIIITDDDDRNK